MKKAIILLVITITVLSITSCAKHNNTIDTAASLDTKNQLSEEMESWLKNAKLDAKENPEELYQKALSEDTLIIYSNSTRIMDVKKSFEKQYPGLTVYIEDIRSVDLLNTLSRKFAAKEYACDIVFCDDNGDLSQKLLPNGAVFNYMPYDIAKKIPSANMQPLLPIVIELQQIFYNSEVYDSPPIHNWWELTEEKYKDKVVMSSPFKSISTKGFVSMILKNNEAMEKAYYDLYGKQVPLLANETAGEAFLRLLFNNGLILVNSSDEVFEMVGTPGQIDPPIGIMISSKIRMKKLGYKIQPIFDMDIFSGVYSSNDIMLAGGCKNINSAKLFIRWILGETDGQGEGYKPYLQNGAWSVRNDIKSKSEKQLNEIKYLKLDTKYMYENKKEIDDFIDKCISNDNKIHEKNNN
ncbi:ABC transporter substrate-binding protein [Anaerovorax odorimutans]|uniref:ABC transporter substrate-binding protein n=1 Tax=Anaerovorax odorimutans TaxID=109327 RepID=UPI000426AE76|nr:extracellular solute-binding protein [Anaerovorax odorimutans]